jgi:isocitrate dehydrogenase
MSQKTPITVAHGDGIGPEIMEAFLTDSYRCRYQPTATAPSQSVTHPQISALYQKVTAAGYDIVKTETLRTFDGQQGFTLAQGQ